MLSHNLSTNPTSANMFSEIDLSLSMASTLLVSGNHMLHMRCLRAMMI